MIQSVISLILASLKLFLTSRANQAEVEKRKSELNNRWNNIKGRWSSSAKDQWDKIDKN